MTKIEPNKQYIPLTNIIEIIKSNSNISSINHDLLHLYYTNMIHMDVYPNDFDYDSWSHEALKYFAEHSTFEKLETECLYVISQNKNDYQTVETLCRLYINYYPDSFLEDAPRFAEYVNLLEKGKEESLYTSFIVELVQAYQLYNVEKDYISALNILMENYNDTNETYPEILYHMANIYLIVRDLKSAEKICDEAFICKNESPNCQNVFWDHFAFLCCQIWLMKQNDHNNKYVKKALVEVEKISHRGNIDAKITTQKYIAICYSRLGLKEKYEMALKDLQEIYPNDIPAEYYQLKGVCQHNYGDFDMSVESFKRALELDSVEYPLLLEARTYLVDVIIKQLDSFSEDTIPYLEYNNCPKRENVIETLFVCTDIDSYSPFVYFLLGRCYLCLYNHHAILKDEHAVNYLNEAKQCLERACDLYEYEHFEASKLLADAYIDTGDLESYHKLLERLTEVYDKLSKDFKISWVYRRLGIYNLQSGHYEFAIHCFTQVFHQEPNDLVSWKCLAEAYFYNKSYKASMKAFEEVLKHVSTSNKPPQTVVDDQNILYYKNKLAIIDFKMGEHLKAVAAFERILNKRPNYHPSLIGLAETYVDLSMQSLNKHVDAKAKECTSRALGLLLRGILLLMPQKDNSFDHVNFNPGQCKTSTKLTNDMVSQTNLNDLYTPLNWAHFWILAGRACSLLHQLPVGVKVKIPSYSYDDCGDKNNRTKMDGFIEFTLQDLLALSYKFYSMALRLKPDISELWTATIHSLMLYDHFQAKIQPTTKGESKIYRFSRKFAQLCPLNKYVINILGVVAASKDIRNYEMSEEAISRCYEIDSNEPIFTSNLGVLYLLKNDGKMANKSFTKAQISDPKYSQAWIGQATLAEKGGNYEEAIDLYQHTYTFSYNKYNVLKCGKALLKLFCLYSSHSLESQANANHYSLTPQNEWEITTERDLDYTAHHSILKDGLRIHRILNYTAIQLDALALVSVRYPFDYRFNYLHSQLYFNLNGNSHVTFHIEEENSYETNSKTDSDTSSDYTTMAFNTRDIVFHSGRALELFLSQFPFKNHETNVSNNTKVNDRHANDARNIHKIKYLVQLSYLNHMFSRIIYTDHLKLISIENLSTLAALLEHYCFLALTATSNHSFNLRFEGQENGCNHNQTFLGLYIRGVATLIKDFKTIFKSWTKENKDKKFIERHIQADNNFLRDFYSRGITNDRLVIDCLSALCVSTLYQLRLNMRDNKKALVDDLNFGKEEIFDRVLSENHKISQYDKFKIRVLSAIQLYLITPSNSQAKLTKILKEEELIQKTNNSDLSQPVKTKSSKKSNYRSKHNVKGREMDNTADLKPVLINYYAEDYYLNISLSILQVLNHQCEKVRKRSENLLKLATYLMRGDLETRKSQLLYIQFAAALYNGSLDQELSKFSDHNRCRTLNINIPIEAVEVTCHSPHLINKYSDIFEKNRPKPNWLTILVHIMLGHVAKSYKLAQSLYHENPSSIKSQIVLSLATYGHFVLVGNFDICAAITESCVQRAQNECEIESDLYHNLLDWLYTWFAFIQMCNPHPLTPPLYEEQPKIPSNALTQLEMVSLAFKNQKALDFNNQEDFLCYLYSGPIKSFMNEKKLFSNTYIGNVISRYIIDPHLLLTSTSDDKTLIQAIFFHLNLYIVLLSTKNNIPHEKYFLLLDKNKLGNNVNVASNVWSRKNVKVVPSQDNPTNFHLTQETSNLPLLGDFETTGSTLSDFDIVLTLFTPTLWQLTHRILNNPNSDDDHFFTITHLLNQFDSVFKRLKHLYSLHQTTNKVNRDEETTLLGSDISFDPILKKAINSEENLKIGETEELYLSPSSLNFILMLAGICSHLRTYANQLRGNVAVQADAINKKQHLLNMIDAFIENEKDDLYKIDVIKKVFETKISKL
ncbi:uncharacterized protein LOC135930802 [Gordionus sp. m RMFG-2023]|uniref:uncharacterized protein LOC135930802 n=1 Tax=Gordionus sp. m RMFG-2023 TaxID=3053472 RepID=UPI0031FDC735